jgi:dCTP deaminase
MYLSDRDPKYAVERGHLIVDPPPTVYGPSDIDLHLDRIEEAKVWKPKAHAEDWSGLGAGPPYVGFQDFDYKKFSSKYAGPVPDKGPASGENQKVYRDGNRVIVHPGGFLLWLTREAVGAPTDDARYICFINGKSTRARLGLLVHMTAPTIEAGWWGQVTLEIANLGPFTLALQEGDKIAQIVVSTLSCAPEKKKEVRGVPVGQRSVLATGTPTQSPGRAPKQKKAKQ